jgi:hypothetical protein
MDTVMEAMIHDGMPHSRSHCNDVFHSSSLVDVAAMKQLTSLVLDGLEAELKTQHLAALSALQKLQVCLAHSFICPSDSRAGAACSQPCSAIYRATGLSVSGVAHQRASPGPGDEPQERRGGPEQLPSGRPGAKDPHTPDHFLPRYVCLQDETRQATPPPTGRHARSPSAPLASEIYLACSWMSFTQIFSNSTLVAPPLLLCHTAGVCLSYGAGVRAIPDGISALRQLEELCVRGCTLAALPPGLSTLRTLRRIDAADNGFGASAGEGHGHQPLATASGSPRSSGPLYLSQIRMLDLRRGRGQTDRQDRQPDPHAGPQALQRTDRPSRACIPRAHTKE